MDSAVTSPSLGSSLSPQGPLHDSQTCSDLVANAAFPGVRCTGPEPGPPSPEGERRPWPYPTGGFPVPGRLLFCIPASASPPLLSLPLFLNISDRQAVCSQAAPPWAGQAGHLQPPERPSPPPTLSGLALALAHVGSASGPWVSTLAPFARTDARSPGCAGMARAERGGLGRKSLK